MKRKQAEGKKIKEKKNLEINDGNVNSFKKKVHAKK